MVTRLISSKYTIYVFFLCLNFCHARTITCHWAIHQMEQNQRYACSQLDKIFCSSSLLEQFITPISCHFNFGYHRHNLKYWTYLCSSVPFFMLVAMWSSFVVCPIVVFELHCTVSWHTLSDPWHVPYISTCCKKCRYRYSLLLINETLGVTPK